MSKISVIIPVYNVEEYLSKCIESVIGQTFSDIEIFLVDDGSTDKSGEICDVYEKKDNRINVIHKVNGGLSSARNSALGFVSGEYISFVDSDDYIDRDYYEKLLKAIIDSDSDIAVSGFACDNGLRIKKNQICRRKLIGNHSIFEDYLSSADINHMVVNKIYKSSLFSNLRFPENIRRNEDVWFTTTLLTKVTKAVFVDDCYYNIFIRDNSLERSKFCENDLCLLEVTEYRQNLIKEKYEDLYRYVAYEMVRHIVKIQKRILLQHSFRENKLLYFRFSSRFNDEMEKLPQEYKNGKEYGEYLFIMHHQLLFRIKYELIGFFCDFKQIIKRVLIWIK